MKCYIRENSFIAKIAARKLKASNVAIVMGKTIHLHNTTKQQFINDTGWVRHELVHVKQFRKHGYIQFLIKYLFESIKSGYINNKFEVEARAGEKDPDLDKDFEIVI